MRFRPEQHLRRAAEIRVVRAEGRRIDCRAFTVWWRSRLSGEVGEGGRRPASPPDAPVRLSRVCVIASGAAVGGATLRNRAKRRLREVFRLRQHEVPINCDLLLIARSGCTTWPLAELEKRFVEACRRIEPAGTATGEK
jgi:ribonuclease P protein component